jgi:2-oxoisovalerate dehydrogenase E1 component
MREASLDTAVPFAPTLEANFLPTKRLAETLRRLLAF